VTPFAVVVVVVVVVAVPVAVAVAAVVIVVVAVVVVAAAAVVVLLCFPLIRCLLVWSTMALVTVNDNTSGKMAIYTSNYHYSLLLHPIRMLRKPVILVRVSVSYCFVLLFSWKMINYSQLLGNWESHFLTKRFLTICAGCMAMADLSDGA
jgi:hypothetical protein